MEGESKNSLTGAGRRGGGLAAGSSTPVVPITDGSANISVLEWLRCNSQLRVLKFLFASTLLLLRCILLWAIFEEWWSLEWLKHSFHKSLLRSVTAAVDRSLLYTFHNTEIIVDTERRNSIEQMRWRKAPFSWSWNRLLCGRKVIWGAEQNVDNYWNRYKKELQYFHCYIFLKMFLIRKRRKRLKKKVRKTLSSTGKKSW